MPSDVQRIYWDSCIVIAYFSNDPDKVNILEAVLDDVSKSDGRKKIVTSLVAKVEVSFVTAERTSKHLSEDVEKKIDNFWAEDSVLELIEFHDGIASLSRRIIRDGIPNGWRLKPMDAIHLASAKWLEVTEFHTYNLSDFQRYEKDMGFKICEPYVSQPKMF